jgi:hypothetical protein
MVMSAITFGIAVSSLGHDDENAARPVEQGLTSASRAPKLPIWSRCARTDRQLWRVGLEPHRARVVATLCC